MRPTQPTDPTDPNGDFLSRLEGMRGMKDNWDSYGAVAPDQETINKAIAFVQEFLHTKLNMCCSPNGNICFESKNSIIVEIGPESEDDTIWIDEDAYPSVKIESSNATQLSSEFTERAIPLLREYRDRIETICLLPWKKNRRALAISNDKTWMAFARSVSAHINEAVIDHGQRIELTLRLNEFESALKRLQDSTK